MIIETKASEPFSYQDHKILIVDDNPTNIGVLLEYLQSYGFEIMIARSGESALEKAQYSPPDIILLDVMMSGMDGFETCQRLKEKNTLKDIPVIFMTALTRTEEKIKGFTAGAVDYVTKPLHQEEVLARVTTHLHLRNLRQNLQKANEELAELNANKDKFLTIVSADLQQQLNKLMSTAQLTKLAITQYGNKTLQEKVDGFYSSAQATYGRLENLVTWSLLQQGQITFNPTHLNLNDLLSKSLYLLAEKTNEKEIKIANTIKDNLFVTADISMLIMITHNLIHNAVRFTPRQGTISISAKVDAGGANSETKFVTVTINDTGVGINKADIGKLFRIDGHHVTADTEKVKGGGLGLILCHEIITRHGGKIWVESIPRQGTKVHFTLPQAP